MAGAFEKGNLLSILAAGRKPQWVEQTGHEGAPDSTGDGVYLENSLQTYVVVEVRENVAYRTAVFTGDGLELAIEIDLTFDGINQADGTQCTATIWEAVLAPDSEFDFLADDFGNVNLTGTLKTPTGKDAPYEVLIQNPVV